MTKLATIRTPQGTRAVRLERRDGQEVLVDLGYDDLGVPGQDVGSGEPG